MNSVESSHDRKQAHGKLGNREKLEQELYHLSINEQNLEIISKHKF